ncbi:MAG: hypothetical protein QW244_03280 [Candidatus Pacearchaeota archaeon]
MKKFDFNKITLLLASVIIIIFIANLFIISGIKNELTTKAISSVKLQYVIKLENETVLKSGMLDSVIGKVSRDLGLNSLVIDNKIINMSEGEEVHLKLAAKDAFGEYDLNKVFIINRTEKIIREREMDRIFNLPLQNVIQVFGETPVVNKTYNVPGDPLQYKVLKINGTDVELIIDAQPGKIIPLNEIMFMNITEVTSDKIKAKLNAYEQTIKIPAGNLTISIDKDYIYLTLTPALDNIIILGNTQGKVVNLNETSIVLDSNPEFAGLDVIIELKILEKK